MATRSLVNNCVCEGHEQLTLRKGDGVWLKPPSYIPFLFRMVPTAVESLAIQSRFETHVLSIPTAREHRSVYARGRGVVVRRLDLRWAKAADVSEQ